MKNIEKLALDITKVLSSFGFRSTSKYEWARRSHDVVQVVMFELTQGGNLRVRVFSIAYEGNIVSIGGNLTQSSIGGGEVIGGDYYWDFNDYNFLSENVSTAINKVAIPWFSYFFERNNIERYLEKNELYQSYSLNQYYTRDYLSNLEVLSIENKFSSFSSSEFHDFILKNFSEKLYELGFETNDDAFSTYLRKRNDIYDVIIFKLINYGMHFGLYAFNWHEKLAINDPKMFSEDSAFMLNGGVLSESGLGIDSGTSFLLSGDEGSSNCIKDVWLSLENIVLPELEETVDLKTFKKSVRPDMQIISQRFLQ